MSKCDASATGWPGDVGTSCRYVTRPNQAVGAGAVLVLIMRGELAAWHAGYSSVHGREDCNDWTLGYEICNAIFYFLRSRTIPGLNPVR